MGTRRQVNSIIFSYVDLSKVVLQMLRSLNDKSDSKMMKIVCKTIVAATQQSC